MKSNAYADRHIDMPTGTSICRFMPSRHIDVSVHVGRHNDMPGVQLLDLLQPLEYNRSLCCVQVGDLRAISPSFLPSTFWRWHDEARGKPWHYWTHTPHINTKETHPSPFFCADSDFVSGNVRIRLVLMIFMDNTRIQIEKPTYSHLHECSGVILAYLAHYRVPFGSIHQ